MKLSDFGISRVLNEDETTIFTDVKGTNGWMAAEIVGATNCGKKCRFKRKSDIQVAGMVAFFVLTKGEHPFGNVWERMANILNGNLVDDNAQTFVSLINKEVQERPYVIYIIRRLSLHVIYPKCLIVILAKALIVGQICEQIVHFLLNALAAPFAGCLVFDMVMDIEPAAKLIFSIAKLSFLYFHL